MHKKYVALIFACTHLIFIFLLIYRHTLYVRASFSLQKNERLIATLQHEKEELTNSLYVLQNHEAIKQFAEQELHMQPLMLSQIVKIDGDETRNE
jgi:hypothetical protein